MSDYVFDKGDVIDVIKKFKDKEIVIAEKSFKDTNYLDIRMYEGSYPKSGISLSYRDSLTEVRQLYIALQRVFELRGIIPPEVYYVDKIKDPF
jgi:hypothetical protein